MNLSKHDLAQKGLKNSLPADWKHEDTHDADDAGELQGCPMEGRGGGRGGGGKRPCLPLGIAAPWDALEPRGLVQKGASFACY